MAASLPSGVPFSRIPAGRPPPGVEPLNFVNPPTRENAITAVSAITIALAVIFVTGRVYLNNANKGHKLGWDDAFCVIGLTLSIALTGIEISLNKFARHLWDLPVSWFDASYHKRTYAVQMLVGPAQFFTKVSLLILYLRLFSIKSRIRHALYCAIAFAVCLYWINVPIFTYYCTPRPHSSWGPTSSYQRCEDIMILAPIQGGMNVALDIFILAAPIPVIVKLKISRRRKFGVLAVFMTGLFAIIASIVGLAYRVIFYQHRSGDITWYDSDTTICVIVENHVSLVCSSMPAFASLSKHHLFLSSYLSRLRDRLLNSLHLSNTVKSSKVRGSQASKKTPVQKHSTSWYGMDGSQSPARGYAKMNESFACGQGPVTEVRSSPSNYDVELGERQKSVSLQQLVTKAM